MDLFSIFKGGKYFDKHIAPKCDYCQFGRRAKDGNKVLCEKRGLVDCNDSCNKFIYSPLKRIPVKQLNFVGSLADEDIYIESAGDRAEKEELENPKKKDEPKKDAKKPEASKQIETPKAETKVSEAETPKTTESPKNESAPVAPAQTDAPVSTSATPFQTDTPVSTSAAPTQTDAPASAPDTPALAVEQNDALAEMAALAQAVATEAESSQ